MIINNLILFILFSYANSLSHDSFELCDFTREPLLKSHCFNDGICYQALTLNHTTKEYDKILYCSCNADFNGERCEISSKNSLTKAIQIKCPDWYVCLNGGICTVDPREGPKCICTENFEGINCGKAKYCQDMAKCNLNCDFGYKRKHGCDVCECKCLNEFNYFDEMRSVTNSTNKCKKLCPYGYAKNEFDCFECRCLNEESIKKFDNITCPSEFCNTDETCRFFNSSLYDCPKNQPNCKLYEKNNFIPICYKKNLKERCLDPINIGNCYVFMTRYYYDIGEKICKSFEYTGCGGNINNFNTLEECIKECDPPKESITTRISLASTKPSIQLVVTNQTLAPITTTQSQCKWVCYIECQFGYKLDLKTGCYKCECVELNMTECGVPCYLPGTLNCINANRANSRPLCVCSSDYDGVYCQTLKANFNFSTRIDEFPNVLTPNDEKEFKINASIQLSNKFYFSQKQIFINDLRYEPKDSVIIDFTIFGSDYSNITQFYSLIDSIYNQISNKRLTIVFNSKSYILNLNCDKQQESFEMEFDEKYLISIEHLRRFINELKQDIFQSYKFKQDSFEILKITLEPKLRLEFTILNKNDDPEFCAKSYIFKNDIRYGTFSLARLDAFLFNPFTDENNDEFNFWNTNDQNTRSMNGPSESKFFLSKLNFLNTNFFYIVLIVLSILCIVSMGVFLTFLYKKRKQTNLKRLNESEAYASDEQSTRDFEGYFMSNRQSKNITTSTPKSSVMTK